MGIANECKLTIEQQNSLIEHYKSGLSYKDLGIMFDIGSTTARNIVIKSGVPTRKHLNKKGERLLSPEQESKIIDLYKSGKSFDKIKDELNITWVTVRNTVIRSGTEIRSVGGSCKLTHSQELEICNLYKNGKTFAELGNMYNMDDSSILGIIRRHNIESRPTKERQYSINDHYFDSIDTEEKAYFLGILFALWLLYCDRNSWNITYM